MDQYNEEIYKYLITPDNYKAAKTISDTLSSVVEPRLNKEFWAITKTYLEQALKDSIMEDVRDIIIDETVENFFLKSWNGVSISRDNDDIGIKLDLELINRDKVFELLSQVNKDKHLGDKETRPWPCYFHNHLNSSGDFFNKLPDTRESKISELVKAIYDYIEISVNVCNEINKLKL